MKRISALILMLCARAGADPVIVDQMWKCQTKTANPQWTVVFARVATDNVWSVVGAEIYVQNKDGSRANLESLKNSNIRTLSNGDLYWTGKSIVGNDNDNTASSLYLTMHDAAAGKITGNVDYYNPRTSKSVYNPMDCELLGGN